MHVRRWHAETNTNNIFVTAAQDYIVSYCRAAESDDAPSGQPGTINVSHILSGRCVAKLVDCSAAEAWSRAAGGGGADAGGGGGGGGSGGEGSSWSPPRADGGGSPGSYAPRDVTALHFSEQRNELYVGDKHGVLRVFGQ